MRLATVCLVLLASLAFSAHAGATTLLPAEFPWDAEIGAFEREDAANPPKPGGIVFIGSSSIRLWTTLAEDFPGKRIVNRGFGGSELRDSTQFAPRIVAPHRPRLVVLYAGDNDLANGRTPAQIEQDFRDFVTAVRRDDAAVRVAVIAVKPSPARIALIDAARDTNARFARVADEIDGVDYIDIFTPMLDEHGKPREELFLEDRLHINRAGYRLWAERVRPFLD